MSGSSKTTTNHEEIRQWVEERGGYPAVVKGTAGSDRGILRIDFPEYAGNEALEEVSWNEFFRKFDRSKLAFLYEDRTADGRPSRFAKFVNRSTPQAKPLPGRSKDTPRTRRSIAQPRRKKAA